MDVGFVVFLLQTLLLISHYADGTDLCRPVAVGEPLTLTCRGNAPAYRSFVWLIRDSRGERHFLFRCHIWRQLCLDYGYDGRAVISVKNDSVDSKLTLEKIDDTHKNNTIECKFYFHRLLVDACTIDIFHRPNHTSCHAYPHPNDGVLLSCEVQYTEHSFATNLSCSISFFIKTGKAVTFIPREEIVYSTRNISDGQSVSQSPYVNFRCQTSYIPLSPGTYSYRAQVFLGERVGSQRPISEFYEFTDLITIPSPTINIVPSAVTCLHKRIDIRVSCTAKWQQSPPRFQWYVGDSLVQIDNEPMILTTDRLSYPGLDTYVISTTISINVSSSNARQRLITCEIISPHGPMRKTISPSDMSISVIKRTSDLPVLENKHDLVVNGAVDIQETEHARLLCQVTGGIRSIIYVSVQCWNQLNDIHTMLVNVTSAHDYDKSPVSFFIHGTTDFNNSICHCVAHDKRPCFTTKTSFRVDVSPRILQHNESQQLHNESQKLHNENQQPTHKNIIMYTLPAALMAVFITALCFTTFLCLKRRKKLTCLRDDPYQPTSHVYESVELDSRNCEKPPPLPIRTESRPTETDPLFDDHYETKSHTCDPIEDDSRDCEQSPVLSIARESMAREGDLQFEGSRSTWPGTSGDEQNTCCFYDSFTGMQMSAASAREIQDLESLESASVQDPCYSSVTVYN